MIYRQPDQATNYVKSFLTSRVEKPPDKHTCTCVCSRACMLNTMTVMSSMYTETRMTSLEIQFQSDAFQFSIFCCNSSNTKTHKRREMMLKILEGGRFVCPPNKCCPVATQSQEMPPDLIVLTLTAMWRGSTMSKSLN